MTIVIIRPLFVEYPMHHLEYNFYLDDYLEDAPPRPEEGQEEEDLVGGPPEPFDDGGLSSNSNSTGNATTPFPPVGVNATVGGEGEQWRVGNRSSSNSSSSSSSSSSSTLVPMPHNRFRRPFPVAGYEGVQPVVSMHAVEAHFKDCSYCTARHVRLTFLSMGIHPAQNHRRMSRPSKPG
jgi:hypothetical protein